MGRNISNDRAVYQCQAEILRAMAHPARLRLLALLLEGPACVGELVERTGYRQPYISQHLARLRDAGLVEGIREGLTVCYHVTCPQAGHFLAAVQRLYAHHGKTNESGTAFLAEGENEQECT